MSMETTDAAVSHLGTLVSEYTPQIKDTHSGYGPFVGGTEVEQTGACSRLSAAIDRYTRPGSQYRAEANRINASGHHASARAVQLLGVVQGLRDDYAVGQMRSIEELVHADIFSDFLEMASELERKGFKDPAAVLAGSVLESHLRQLATQTEIPVDDKEGRPRKAEAINAELGKGVYETGDQKSVTAWLDLRNDAAHGHYANYDHKQVALLIESVRAFMTRHPA